jgi:hypothetical protein
MSHPSTLEALGAALGASEAEVLAMTGEDLVKMMGVLQYPLLVRAGLKALHMAGQEAGSTVELLVKKDVNATATAKGNSEPAPPSAKAPEAAEEGTKYHSETKRAKKEAKRAAKEAKKAEKKRSKKEKRASKALPTVPPSSPPSSSNRKRAAEGEGHEEHEGGSSSNGSRSKRIRRSAVESDEPVLAVPGYTPGEFPPHRMVLAPMVGGSELAFRMLCRQYGVDLCYTPMMSVPHFPQRRPARPIAFGLFVFLLLLCVTGFDWGAHLAMRPPPHPHR